MIEPERVALVLLAAGRSRRFNDGDKLVEHFLDKPLAYHVVTALAHVPFGERIAVVWDTELDFAALGYRVVENPDRDSGQAHSLRLGVEAVRDTRCDAALIALADMPRVTAAHVLRLLDGFDGPDAVIASSDGERPGPPALFGKGVFDQLLGIEGDKGARDLIKRGHHVVTSPNELVDVDTQEDLAELRRLYGLKSDGNK